jgi:FlaA1/EpsC-like NDP-sugar epimerase
LRPGEKLYEELLIGDNPQSTTHPRIMKTHEEFMSWQVLRPKLEELKYALQTLSPVEIRGMMCNLVPGYRPNDRPVVDWVYLKQNSKFPIT